MKKLFAILLCVAMVFAIAACGGNNTQGTTTTGTTAGTTTTGTTTPVVTEKDYRLGMGIVVSMASSKTGTAQVDATVATVVLDAEGKIVACRIDVAQNKMTITDGEVNPEAVFETKMELGDRYGMASSPYSSDNNNDGVILEWDAQTKIFENYVVGKTAAEVQAIELQEVNAHNIAVDEALLTAGCTIQITDYIDAIVKACNDEQGVSFKTASEFTLGVAAKTTAADSIAATADANGTVKMYSDFAASVVADGKIIASLNDAIQPNITINADGEIVGTSFKATKRELKEEYGMAGNPYSSDNNGDQIILEWYIQSEAFSTYVVGMTAAEVAGMKTQFVSNHYISADEALLSAGCTIQITGICAVVAQSVTNAR